VDEKNNRKYRKKIDRRLLKIIAIDTIFYTVLMPVDTTWKWCQKNGCIRLENQGGYAR